MIHGPDVTIYLPTEELVEESLGDAYSYTPNQKRRTKKKKGEEERYYFEAGALDLYGGYEGFLVRTAVIRSKDYDPSKAPVITQPTRVWPLIQHLQYADQEHFVTLCFDARQRLLAIHESAIGGTSSVSLQAKHVIKLPLLVSATAAIVAHNHPSGSDEFSADDIRTTEVLKNAFDCVGVTLLDHVLVAREGMASYVDVIGAL